MLVLGDARERDVLVAIVEHRRALKVALVAKDLEVERAIAEPAKLEVEKAIDRPAVDDMRKCLLQGPQNVRRAATPRSASPESRATILRITVLAESLDSGCAK